MSQAALAKRLGEVESRQAEAAKIRFQDHPAALAKAGLINFRKALAGETQGWGDDWPLLFRRYCHSYSVPFEGRGRDEIWAELEPLLEVTAAGGEWGRRR